jgi:hypothetical protein
MGRPPLARRWIVASAAVGIAYAIVASGTHPFTAAADLVTAIPMVVAATGTARVISGRRRNDSAPPVGRDAGTSRKNRLALAWLVPMALAAAWELYCYVHLPRPQHPTLSALIDTLDATRAGKTVDFAAWLALGWFLVTR